MNDFFGLKGKVALVTGAAQGIGYGIARALVSHGVNVALADVNEAVLERLVKEEGQFLAKALTLRMDVSQAADVDQGIRRIIGAFGSLDILVNNAGIVRDALVMRMKEEDWDRVLDVNLKGAFLCAKVAATSMMKSRWGVSSGTDGEPRADELFRCQGRDDRAHQDHSQGTRAPGHYGQRHCPWLYRDVHDTRSQRYGQGYHVADDTFGAIRTDR